MYRVAIADDEIGIREGLKDLVEWESLGFSVCGVFEDGEGLLSLLKDQPPHLIVTDIRMSRCSGLDISKYIQEQKLKTRVVLISGYQETELAMSAIRYGVKNYILKPIDLDELSDCIRKVKEDLDADQEIFTQREELFRAQSDMQDIRKLFFEEILRGDLENQRLIKRALTLLCPEMSYEESACFFITLHIRQYGSFQKSGWKRSPAELSAYVDHFSERHQTKCQIRSISRKEEQLTAFGLLPKHSEPSVREAAAMETSRLCEGIRSSFGVLADPDSLEVFDSIPAMLAGISVSEDSTLGQALEKLVLRQKQLYLVLTNGTLFSLTEETSRFADSLEGLKLSPARELIENLFHTLSDKLRQDGLAHSADLVLKEAFPALASIKSPKGLRELLSHTMQRLYLSLHQDQDSLAERTKDYVMKHIGEDLSLEDVADHFYLSPSYFSRTFKAVTGETFVRFVSRIKMEEAARLLAATDWKIYDICERVGYKSLRHFNKLFKEYMGIQPSGYRQRMHMGGDRS